MPNVLFASGPLCGRVIEIPLPPECIHLGPTPAVTIHHYKKFSCDLTRRLFIYHIDEDHEAGGKNVTRKL